MKGKVAFVLGAAVGYVLGTRAGRERYEQIKRGAQRVWRTEPVQRGVGLVKDAVDDRAEDLKVFAIRVGNDVFSNLMKRTTNQSPEQRARANASSQPASGSDAAHAADAAAGEAEAAASEPAEEAAAPKPASSKSASSKSAPSKSAASSSNSTSGAKPASERAPRSGPAKRTPKARP